MALPPVQDNSLLGRASAEVAPEVSPLLRSLLAHARLIAIVVGLALAGTAGFGIYNWHANSQLEKSRVELGRVEIISDPTVRLKELEVFLAKAPSGMSTAVNLAVAKAALEAKNYDRAAKAWDAVAKDPQDALYISAILGKAQALSLDGKDAEAMAALEKASAPAKDGNKALLDKAIEDLAEKMGNIDKAIATCEALAANNSVISESDYWRQKAVSLRQQQAVKPAEAAK